jgi:uncharacterized RDD family membrane protein YckC
VDKGYWLSKFEGKSAEQLKEIINNGFLYQPEAVEAAKQMLDEGKVEIQKVKQNDTEVSDASEVSLENKLPIVSRLLRLLYYIVDYVIIMVGAVVTSKVLPLSNYSWSQGIGSLNIETNVLNFYVIMFLYYFIFEWKAQRTLGKYLTKTIVVNETGESLSASAAFMRTISRLIPFEAFSCLVNTSLGWHDRLSKTYVINEEDLNQFKSEMCVTAEVSNHLIS